jgi:O-methyltransferase
MPEYHVAMSAGAKLRALVLLLRGDDETRWIAAERLARLAHPDAVLGEHHKRWRTDPGFLASIRSIGVGPRQWDRLYAIDQFAARCATLPGDFAECGTYTGSSAYFLCARAAGEVHLFDSWEGLSEPAPVDGEYWTRGDLRSSLEDARRVLGRFDNAVFHQGWIPERFHEVADRRFSLVHIDVDIYRPTLDALEFFWERVTPGGMVVCDDYGFSTCPGATAAMDEFFEGRAPVMHLPTGQGLVIR